MVVRVSYRQFGHSTRIFRSTSAEGAPTSSQRPTKRRSKYAEWYSDMLPPMIPIALLAATVYGVLEMYRSSLAHERQSIIQAARIADLEHELARLRARSRSSSSPGAGAGAGANFSASSRASSSSSSSSSSSNDGTGSAAAGSGGPVVASTKTAASSDAQAPTAQKGRWWALGWR